MIKDLKYLWFTFFYVGLFTIGGGYAMLPLLEKEVVYKHKWLSREELLDVFAIGQSTPGIIALNVATYVGVGQRGIIGGIIATAGMIMPSLCIIIVIASFVQEISQIPVVLSIFEGIRTVVAALLISAVYTMGKKTIKNGLSLFILFGGFVLIAFFSISPIWVVLGGGSLGVVVYVLFGNHVDRNEGK